jgi:curved DNA-binding protein
MDYYSILGVSKNASDKELKSAYKKLSMQHHPDRTGGSDEKFKQVNEAYSTLKDPRKRQEYDNPPQQQFNTGNPFNPGGMGGFEDVFAQFGFRHPQQRQQQRNQDVTLNYSLKFSEVFTGTAVSLQYKLPSGKMEFLDAAIPAGVQHGSTVRFAGLGDDSIRQFERGNLILRIRVQNDPKWKRDGANVYAVEKIDIFDFIIGSTVEIVTPTNRKFSLNVPAGTKPGTTFSISGHGIPDFNTQRPGNIHIKLEAIMPKLDRETIQKIKDIKDGIS